MPPLPSAHFPSAPCKSRFARTSSFRIFAAAFRPRIQSHCLHLRPDAIAFYPLGILDTQLWGDPASCGSIPGLKQNT
jgi:hypothetical protein